MVDEEHHGRPDRVDGMRAGCCAWHNVAVDCYVCGRNTPVGTQYIRTMDDGWNLMALNLAWLGWEITRWQDVIDWSISAAGALSLVALNVIRLRKVLREQRNVDNLKE